MTSTIAQTLMYNLVLALVLNIIHACYIYIYIYSVLACYPRAMFILCSNWRMGDAPYCGLLRLFTIIL